MTGRLITSTQWGRVKVGDTVNPGDVGGLSDSSLDRTVVRIAHTSNGVNVWVEGESESRWFDNADHVDVIEVEA